LVIVTIPLKNYRDVPVEPLSGKVVIDTNNYYPSRDGQFPELDADTTTSSELLAAHLPASHIVKCFNTIYYENLAKQGLPADDPARLSLPIAGDDDDAKTLVTTFLDTIGYGAVDAGALVEGRRFQPGTPAYVGGLPVPELRTVLGLA
jgi:predicted dinucleotide-binding enzyme